MNHVVEVDRGFVCTVSGKTWPMGTGRTCPHCPTPPPLQYAEFRSQLSADVRLRGENKPYFRAQAPSDVHTELPGPSNYARGYTMGGFVAKDDKDPLQAAANAARNIMDSLAREREKSNARLLAAFGGPAERAEAMRASASWPLSASANRKSARQLAKFDIRTLAKSLFATDARIQAIVNRVTDSTTPNRSVKDRRFRKLVREMVDVAAKVKGADTSPTDVEVGLHATCDARTRALTIAWKRERGIRHECLRRAVAIFAGLSRES